MRAVRKGKETQEEHKYALPTQRKVPIGRNRCVIQSNLILVTLGSEQSLKKLG